MKALVVLSLALLGAPALAQSAPDCGEPCKLAQTVKELRTLPKLPAKDPMPGGEFEPVVKAYSDCTVQAFHDGGGDWAAPADKNDGGLKQASIDCSGKRIAVQAQFIAYFEKNSPGLTMDQKRVYGAYVIGMHSMMTLNTDADGRGQRDPMRAYLMSRVDKEDFVFGLDYFDAGE